MSGMGYPATEHENATISPTVCVLSTGSSRNKGGSVHARVQKQKLLH